MQKASDSWGSLDDLFAATIIIPNLALEEEDISCKTEITVTLFLRLPNAICKFIIRMRKL